MDFMETDEALTPPDEATAYMKKHRLPELFQNALAALIYERPGEAAVLFLFVLLFVCLFVWQSLNVCFKTLIYSHASILVGAFETRCSDKRESCTMHEKSVTDTSDHNGGTCPVASWSLRLSRHSHCCSATLCHKKKKKQGKSERKRERERGGGGCKVAFLTRRI